MRLIAAGLFVFIAMLAIVGVVGRLGLLDRSSHGGLGVLGGGLMGLVMLVLIIAALVLFNLGSGSSNGKKIEAHLKELEEQGLLEWVTFHATRGFGVEEHEDEGSHYFVELTDGRVLYLCGQYLYDYEPIADEPGYNQPRSFPCTEFKVRRHVKDGSVVELVCAGTPFEPEAMASSFGDDVWDEDRVPHDGQIFTNVSYDDLKRQHLSRAS